MKGKTFLAWGFVALDRAYLSKSLRLPLIRTISSGTDKILQADTTDGESKDSSLLGYRGYRLVLEKEISDKKMTLTNNPVALNRMINDFYIPVYSYLRSQLNNHVDKYKDQENKPPLFIGVSAPQGYGKTTLTNFMRSLFAAEGENCIAVSIDDFYLTGADQDALAQSNPGNPLLEFRGNAPVDIVLFEGWMLGFTPLGGRDLNGAILPEHVQSIDARLEEYEELHNYFDAWLVIAVMDAEAAYRPATGSKVVKYSANFPAGTEAVYEWRLQAEREAALKRTGGKGSGGGGRRGGGRV